MNCLIVDDINLVGISIKEKLLSLGYNDMQVCFYLYDVDKELNENTKNIFELIVENNIDFLILDRGYYKIIDDDEFIYYSRLQDDNIKKIQCDELLFGSGNNGLLNMITNKNHILNNLLIYTYDPFTPKINDKLKILKQDLKNTLPKTNIYIKETSTVFKKPKKLELYPDNFISHPNNNKNNSKLDTSKTIISTKKVFIEYSHLISDLIDDIVKLKNKQITSYTNPKNLDFEEFVINFNSLNLTSFKLASVAFLHNDSINEDYVLDFPYRSYYKELNKKIIEKNYLNLFMDANNKYLFDSWIYYDYNYKDEEFILYNISYNNVLNTEYIEKWLPLLNSSIFHESIKWNIEKFNKIEKDKSEPNHSIRLIFYFSRVKTLYLDGHINLTFFQESDDNYPESYIKNITIPNIKNILGFIITKSSEYIIPKFQEQIIKQSTRAAISQVMARNMSHNIGSHVMSRMITQDRLKAIVDFKSDNKSLFKNYQELKPLSVDITGLDLLSTFNSYQKTRMDFLADITFGEPTLESSRLLFSEIVSGLDNNRLLLEYISGTDDFKYQFVCRNLTSCSNECIEKINDNDTCISCIINENSLNDINVSIPNDILGYHAFYLIIENIIRNCAKHGKREDAAKILKLYIDVKENAQAEDYYEINIYDDNIMEIIDLNNLIEKQNTQINDDVLQNDGTLRQGAWGLIEMESAAAYLRKSPVNTINDDDFDIDKEDNSTIFSPNSSATTIKKPNYLKAINVRNKHYGYRLFVHKPKEVLIVLSASEFDKNKNLSDASKKKLGIKAIHIDELASQMQKNHVYAYPIMLYIGSAQDYDLYLKDNATALPNRQLVYFTDENNTLTSTRFIHILNKGELEGLNLESEDIINHTWKTWILKQNEYLNIKISKSTFYKSNMDKGIYDLNSINYFSKIDFSNTDSVNSTFSSHSTKEGNEFLEDSKRKNKDYAEPYNSKDLYVLRKLIKMENEIDKKTLDKKDFSSFCKLIEATNTTIHIIDERIQELAEKTTYKPETSETQKEDQVFTDLLYCTHVIIPLSGSKGVKTKRKNEKEINLNISDFSNNYNCIVNYIRSCIRRKKDNSVHKTKADFLLIHLGILEKLIGCTKAYEKKEYKKDHNGVKEFIEEILLGNDLMNVETKIIIISGRGKPHNMPINYLYLNFSIVSQYCIENRLKIFLNEAVFSSKKIN